MIDLVKQRGLLVQGGPQVGGLFVDLPLEFVVRPLHGEFEHVFLGHVGLGGIEIDELFRIVADRRDRHGVPEGGSVLAVVLKLHLDGNLPAHGIPNAIDRPRVGIGSLEHPTIMALQLLPGITGEIQKGVVDPDDGVVGEAGVGHHHGRGTGSEGHGEHLGIHEGITHRTEFGRNRVVAAVHHPDITPTPPLER